MTAYTIQAGDTLRGIALRFYGDPERFPLIQTANGITNPNLIALGQVLDIPEIEEPASDLTRYHRVFDGGVRWRLVAEGVEIEGSGIERSGGEPRTVTRIWEAHASGINTAAMRYHVPCVAILATAATESGGNPLAIRFEPGYISDEATPNQVSPGMMQTLISTARGTLHDPSIDRAWLFDADQSLRAGTSYIAEQRSRTEMDPPRIACAYNAGGVYHNPSPHNRWRMRQYPIGTSEHCDRFVKWFNDAVFVLASHPVQSAVDYRAFYGL